MNEPSKLKALAFDEDSWWWRTRLRLAPLFGMVPFAAFFAVRLYGWNVRLAVLEVVIVGLFAIFFMVRVARKRTLVVGAEGFVLESRFGRARFVPFEHFESVQIDGQDVIVRVSIDSNVRLRTPSNARACDLRNTLRRWFELHNEFLSVADEIDSSATTYRAAACDPMWSVTFSPVRPIDERARAAIHLFRDDAARRSPNADRLAAVAAASAHPAFDMLVRALVSGAPMTERGRQRVARELRLRLEELG